MSTINSETLINNFPEDRDTVQRLLAIFDDSQERTRLKEFTLKRLFDRTLPRSEIALAQILNYLVSTGSLKRIVRVESPNLGGVEDFSSLMEVPEVIHDWRRDIEMCVTPEDINIIYKVISDFGDGAR